MENWNPDVIVAIDFGMTCTAVGYSSSPAWVEPVCIQQWPGSAYSSGLINKVPTQVGYDDNDLLVNWGLKCKFDKIPINLQKDFKIYLDPTFIDAHDGRPSPEEASRYYQDYMRSLYQYLETFFRARIPEWPSRKVEFLFSIPTTWKNPQLTAKLEQLLATAGFNNTQRRKIKIWKTEAEAAAVYAAKHLFKVGDIVMVADAGGSTTDINIMEIKEHNNDKTILKALTKAEGINVGSTMIDWQVMDLIKTKLRALNLTVDEEHIHWAAEDMMEAAAFESFKCGFDGTQMYLNMSMPVPQDILSPARRNQNLRIVVTMNELKELFDGQLKIMFDKIQQQKAALIHTAPTRAIDYIVLSGGLGSSAYVINQFKQQYSGLEVICASEPQLAVAKGLVINRVQEFRKGVEVYTGKCSRVSFGVLCRQRFHRVQHRGEKVQIDALDRKRWAEEQIDWLIKEGEPVPEDGFKRPYQLKIPKGSENESFKAQFVMSESSRDNLPKSTRFENVTKVCTIHARFYREEFSHGSASSEVKSFKYVKGGVFGGEPHYVAEFDLKIVIGSADLRFELYSKDGRKYNQNQAQVQVDWEEAVAKPATAPSGDRSMYAAAPGKHKLFKRN